MTDLITRAESAGPDAAMDNVERVEVTQADREAYLALNMLPEFDRADVLAGRWDGVTGVQAFARHRISALSDQRVECVKLGLEAAFNASAECICVEQALDAIRALDAEAIARGE